MAGLMVAEREPAERLLISTQVHRIRPADING